MDDLSALIFVALAVAWAVYLVPKALQHHEDAQRSRSVDRFSHTMRVLARREPVNRRTARLVVSPGRTLSAPIITTKHVTTRPPAPLTRAAAAGAARRRRRVLGLITLLLLTVAGVAAFGVISWWYVAVPGGLLVAWLVACRVMVRRERAVPVAVPVAPEPAQESVEVAEGPVEDDEAPVDPFEDTMSSPPVTDPDLWDPMPVTLPTYVSKPAARQRAVRTIDLDSTGVWTSGRTEIDAALARQSEEDERVRRAAQVEQQRRASGS